MAPGPGEDLAGEADLAAEAPAVRCKRCGWSGEMSETARGACPTCRSFVAGNEVALAHGAKRFIRGRGTPLDEARRAELVADVTADLGGEAELSAVRRALVTDFAAAVVLRDLCSGHLAAVGPFTSSGKRRAAVDLYLQASQRAERLAEKVGLERKARPAQTLESWIDSRAKAAERSTSEAGS